MSAAAFDPRGQAAPFFRALFEDGGFIEVRLIVEAKGGAIVGRKWFASVDDLLAALPGLSATAEQRGAGVFFGVLPRKAHGCGKAEDVAPGRVVWADVDYKDFSGGESEARAKLDAYPNPPSIVVRSAHGLHLYWLLDAAAAPDRLSAASKAVARSVGGDHTHDAARLLRPAGTYNRKDPSNPVLVEVEVFEPARRYRLEEFSVAVEASRAAHEAPSSAGMSVRVRDFVEKNRRVKDAFHGRGKREYGRDGKPLDTSSSGYDFSLARELVKAGVADVEEIAAALEYRPDGHARSKGRDYALRTARKALEGARTGRASAPAATKVTRYLSEQSLYDIEIDGKTIRFTTADLLNRNKWKQKLTDALGRVPNLPPKIEFDEFVNGVLAGAVDVDLPPESSDSVAMRNAIMRIVETATGSRDSDSVEAGETLVLVDGEFAGCKAFTLEWLLKTLKETFEGVSRQALSAKLRDMGAVDMQLPTGKRPRVWAIPSIRARENSEGVS